jgi:hypothetical protein
MSPPRQIEKLIEPEPVIEGAGVRLNRSIATRRLNYLDPMIPHPRLVVLGDGDYVKVTTGNTPARFLLVPGKPLHEPIARYGPFVMNTEEELEQTLLELRQAPSSPRKPCGCPGKGGSRHVPDSWLCGAKPYF